VAATLTPERARAIGRIGGLTTSATTDSLERLKPAHDAFMQRFIDEVDPQRELPEPERLRRAEAAKKAYFARLALKSAEVRTAKAASRKEAA
jgi:hypothetical protein